MRNRIILLFVSMLSLQAFAQRFNPHQMSAFGDNIYFDNQPDRESIVFAYNTISGIYIPDDAVFRIFSKDLAKEHKLSSPIALGIKLNPKLVLYGMMPVPSFNKSFPAFRINDGSAATVIAMGINKANVDQYRYRVVLNDSTEIIHWSKIPSLEQKYGAKEPYGFIGNFQHPGKQAMVEVVNVNNYNLRAGAVFDWRTDLKPFPFGITAETAPNGPPGSPDFDAKKDSLTQQIISVSAVKGTTRKISLYFKPHAGVAFGSSISRAENGKLLYRSQGTDEDRNGVITFDIDTLPPSRYNIVIFPMSGGALGIGGQNADIELNITPPPKMSSILEEKASFKQLIPYLIGAALTIALLFVLYRRRAYVRLVSTVRAKQNISLQMRSIRAQLNPHFMFNALTSIQNLVNQNDIERANHYLARFAGLTRKVLNTGEKDLISLEDELKILDDYLQMEQLRFGFQYHIVTDGQVNQANTDVPAMLLQPFVENAVKHGVADMRERGSITINIRKENNDLNLIITDNGMGFKPGPGQEGGGSFGLKLSEERIELLNQLYSGKPFSLIINSNADGTVVTISLKDWLS